MKRLHLVELEDLSWWPRLFRDAATDYLVTAIRQARLYDAMAPILASAMRRSGAHQITDLCSGGGGPWPTLLPALRAAGMDASVRLTDKYPNVEALSTLSTSTPGLSFEPSPVDAASVPPNLSGFRTLFTAFHHFRDDDAHDLLAAAVRDRRGIAIVEPSSRTWPALAVQALVPLGVLILTPKVRPFRWSRLFWTYVVPVLPLAILFDGVVSTLRMRTPAELLELAREAAPESYSWESGVVSSPGSPLPIPYLIGVPRVEQGQAGLMVSSA
ncbi:class I SAM-dependent methyltransferase [Paludisphaera rhizosphaerae]|uniref:class I SAM-dependent methyltransferase n=1 Tax=Paludisphaera rhizosphaerae TaxID=2711216 RepID=UPI0013EDD07F|nr:class I SAM-dependent methyltransferase [Paludisphaera rhizosphaerae]